MAKHSQQSTNRTKTLPTQCDSISRIAGLPKHASDGMKSTFEITGANGGCDDSHNPMTKRFAVGKVRSWKAYHYGKQYRISCGEKKQF